MENEKTPAACDFYVVRVTETLQRHVVVFAKSAADATQTVDELTADGAIDLGYDDFCGREVAYEHVASENEMALYEHYDEFGYVNTGNGN